MDKDKKKAREVRGRGRRVGEGSRRCIALCTVCMVGTGPTRPVRRLATLVVTALRVGRVTDAGRGEMGMEKKISFCGITEFM